FLHHHGQQGDDLVAVDLPAQLVAGQAPVGVPVKGDAAVVAAGHHFFLDLFQVGAAHPVVDVFAVRRHPKEGAFGPQPGEQLLGHRGGRAVGAVDADVQARQVPADGLIQVIHIVPQAVGPVGHLPHPGPGGQGDVPAVVVDVGLDAGFHLVGQLVAGGGEHFDAVELHRIV